MIEKVPYPNGHACSYVKKIEVNVRYDELKVYIPREIPRGSCGFDSVKTHELKHVATEEAVLAENRKVNCAANIRSPKRAIFAKESFGFFRKKIAGKTVTRNHATKVTGGICSSPI